MRVRAEDEWLMMMMNTRMKGKGRGRLMAIAREFGRGFVGRFVCLFKGK